MLTLMYYYYYYYVGYSQLNNHGSRLDFVHLHEGKALGANGALLLLVVFELKEYGRSCQEQFQTIFCHTGWTIGGTRLQRLAPPQIKDVSVMSHFT